MHQCTCHNGDTPAIDLALLEDALSANAADPGALIPVLQAAQAVYGYLPEAALRHIAARRAVPLAEVYGVATFYAQFHLTPRGKTVVRICHGTACHVAGAPEVTRALTEELRTNVGETSEDGRFTVEGVACVGCCGLAPVVVVDDQVHGQTDAGAARRLGKKLMREAPK